MTQCIEDSLTYNQVFDAENRLISVNVNSQSVQLIYDGDGNMVKKIKPDGSKTICVGRNTIYYSPIIGLSLSVKLTTIALLALIKFSGVIMISSPHCPAPVPRIGSLSRLASRKDRKPAGCQ